MKHPSQREEHDRFTGSLRHYHRSVSQPMRTWDEWVDGKPASSRSTNWLKISSIILAVFALSGIIVGLIIELR